MKRLFSLLLTTALSLSLTVPAFAATTFPDVAADAWYHDAVISAVESELFSGLSDGSFAPDTKMNRAMMVTVLAALEFGEAGAPKTNSNFTDLTADWYKNAAGWAAANRAQTAVILTSFSKLIGG